MLTGCRPSPGAFRAHRDRTPASHLHYHNRKVHKGVWLHAYSVAYRWQPRPGHSYELLPSWRLGPPNTRFNWLSLCCKILVSLHSYESRKITQILGYEAWKLRIVESPGYAPVPRRWRVRKKAVAPGTCRPREDTPSLGGCAKIRLLVSIAAPARCEHPRDGLVHRLSGSTRVHYLNADFALVFQIQTLDKMEAQTSTAIHFRVPAGATSMLPMSMTSIERYT